MSQGHSAKITVPSKGHNQPLPSTGPRVPPQDFEAARRECLAKKCLFEDPYFPADDSSLFFNKPPRKFEWKRPKEICADPKLFVGGASRMDVKQGILGDCWLLAAIAALAEDNILMKQVIPDNQSFSSRYCGIFHFKFWHFGRWVDICVDDRLPTFNGRLVFLQSKDGNEFWSALLEKAYAKLYGSYEALKGGRSSEAMEDFTGGVVEAYDLKKTDDQLFTTIQKATEKKCLMSCSLKADPKVTEAVLPNGLVKGHAYTLTGVKKFDTSSGIVKLVRIRNPWGNEQEWKGDWSDNSSKWSTVSASVKKEIGLALEKDGEFWMSFSDFKKEFDDMEICNVTLDSFDETEDVKGWNAISFDGAWLAASGNAGGCRNYPTFAKNPQFRLQLQEDADGDGKCSTLLALMQKDRRAQRKMGVRDLCIGFAIYKAPEDGSDLTNEYVQYHHSVATSGSYTNTRSVYKRFELDPGNYIVVCTTFKPNEEGDFLLRAYTEKYAEPRKRGQEGHSDSQVKEETTKALFKRLAGEDNAIDAEELRDLMTATLKKDVSFPAFSMEACRTMICLLDKDHSGSLEYEEFKTLLNYISKWKVAFRTVDRDRSGTMEKNEVIEALLLLGLEIPKEAYPFLFSRFAREREWMGFDDFVACCCRAEIMHDVFKKCGTGDNITLSKTEFFKYTFNA